MTVFEKKVYEYLLTIPKGFVVSYGQLAEAIGYPGGARAVGNALHKNPDTEYYPCYKVVSASGKLAKSFALGIEEQKIRLEHDGIEVKNYRVNMTKYQRK